MDVRYKRCCGIDVHKKKLTACFFCGEKKEIREFSTTTKDLLQLAEWLVQNQCENVMMESTGSYWKPLYNILEAFDIPANVVNARHIKAVPGRKTDMKDAEWLGDLARHGLLKPSYIPPKRQRELRELVTYRKSLVEDRSRELNRLQKILEGGNIKLSGTISNINGKSGRTLVQTLLTGQKIDCGMLERLEERGQLSKQLKATKEQLAEDLNGVLIPMQKIIIGEILSHLDELDKHIKNLDQKIDDSMNEEEKEAVKLLKTIPGVGNTSAQNMIAVIGPNVDRFATDKHLASWAGLCPGNNESAGKRKSGRTRQGNAVLKTTLVVCANVAVKIAGTYFHARYQKIVVRRGGKRALVAVAHSMLKAIWHMLSERKEYQDLGGDYYNRFNKENKIKRHLKALDKLGWTGESRNLLPI